MFSIQRDRSETNSILNVVEEGKGAPAPSRRMRAATDIPPCFHCFCVLHFLIADSGSGVTPSVEAPVVAPSQIEALSSYLQTNQTFHPFEVGRMVPPLSGKCETLTCPSASHCKTLVRPNVHLNYLHTRYLAKIECLPHLTKRLINAVLYHLSLRVIFTSLSTALEEPCALLGGLSKYLAHI